MITFDSHGEAQDISMSYPGLGEVRAGARRNIISAAGIKLGDYDFFFE